MVKDIHQNIYDTMESRQSSIDIYTYANGDSRIFKQPPIKNQSTGEILGAIYNQVTGADSVEVTTMNPIYGSPSPRVGASSAESSPGIGPRDGHNHQHAHFTTLTEAELEDEHNDSSESNDNQSDDDDEKSISLKRSSPTPAMPLPPDLARQITAYCFSKYAPSRLKELVEEVFSDTFDVDNNGDIDFDEFKSAIKNLGTNLSDERITKLFQMVNGNDGDTNDQYVDKVNFSDFLLEKYYHQPVLQDYQEELLRLITPRFPDAAVAVETPDVVEERDMRHRLSMMMEDDMQRKIETATFHELLDQKRKEHKENGERFGDETNAENWDPFEVAYWIGYVLGFRYCMKRFHEEEINGNMLLWDVDGQVLYIFMRSEGNV